MNYHELCQIALELDPQIRFTGVLNDKGELISDVFKEGVDSFLSSEEIRMSVHYSMQRRENVSNLAYKIGNEKFSITEYEKVTLISIPLNEKELFFLSTEPKADYFKIINKTNSLLKNYSV